MNEKILNDIEINFTKLKKLLNEVDPQIIKNVIPNSLEFLNKGLIIDIEYLERTIEIRGEYERLR